MDSEKISIDNKTLNRLKIMIIGMERENLKTKRYNQREMTRRIIKKIEMEVLD